MRRKRKKDQDWKFNAREYEKFRKKVRKEVEGAGKDPSEEEEGKSFVDYQKDWEEEEKNKRKKKKKISFKSGGGLIVD